VALLVAARHSTESVGEEEVTLESQELGGEFAVGTFEYLLHRDRGVVVGDLGRHTPKNSNELSCAAWKVSVHSRGKAVTKKASE
jgi:hypothetical protein